MCSNLSARLMFNCGEYNFNMFIILQAYFNKLCNVTTWGELLSESGASCLSVSLMWGELSLGELSCVTHVKTIAQKDFIYSFYMVRHSLHIMELTLSLKWCECSQQYRKFSEPANVQPCNKIYRSVNYFNQSHCRN